jgi:hypothetical protein
MRRPPFVALAVKIAAGFRLARSRFSPSDPQSRAPVVFL